MGKVQGPARGSGTIPSPAPQTKKGDGANWYAPKSDLGKLEPFNDRTRLRQQYSDFKKSQYRREQRMGLVGDRPESDFDTEKLGEAILEFAKEYRKLKPNATLSEAADQFFVNMKLATRFFSNSVNGKGTPSI